MCVGKRTEGQAKALVYVQHGVGEYERSQGFLEHGENVFLFLATQ
jgi:hypothetical protein